ncbi:MarR family winged helix-turn-helix transcriptional regulator [Radicibacter daui]|uniref:MarR family winged helix-turn-helix transcriptional regulator n=1 Tax=Radicibacter daui TaxID=3064829 RepID=UPI004046CDD3
MTAPDQLSADEALQLENLLCFTVYSTAHAFNRVYKPLLDSIGLTYPQYLVMLTLWQQDDQTVGAIGEKLMLESSTLTPLLKRLEAAGLIARRRDAADERQVRISLTGEGRELRQKALAVPQQVGAATGCTLAEMQQLQARLTLLREDLLNATGR